MARLSAAMHVHGIAAGPLGRFALRPIEVANEVAFDCGEMVEHGPAGRDRVARLDSLEHARIVLELCPVQCVAMSGAARRLAEDSPVVRQLEEQIAAAFE